MGWDPHGDKTTIMAAQMQLPQMQHSINHNLSHSFLEVWFHGGLSNHGSSTTSRQRYSPNGFHLSQPRCKNILMN